MDRGKRTKQYFKFVNDRINKIGIIGAGKVGTALAIALHKNGFNVLIASRSKKSAEKAAKIACIEATSIKEVVKRSDFIFLSVPDGEIVNVAKKIAPIVKKEQIVAHLSGALPSTIINFLKAKVISIHPLKSFADPLESSNTMQDTVFTSEGDKEALKKAKEIVAIIGGKFITIKTENKPLYHIAAVLVSNYTVALFYIAKEIFSSIGFSNEDSTFALLKLLKGTTKNIETFGIPSALTGPIERGDISTIKLHLKAIEDNPRLTLIYKIMGSATIDIAEEKGLDKKKANEMRRLLNG